MKYILSFLFALLLSTALCFAQTKTVVIPPSKDTARITIVTTTTTSTDVKVDYLSTGTGNKPPIASAGNDMAITLPVNTVTLSAVSSTDADGSIATYLWSKVSGPDAILNQVNSALNVSGLTQGVYVFRVTVTDNGGLTDDDDITVVVNPASTPGPVGGTLTFSAGYNSTSEINTNQGMYNTISTDLKIEGAGSFRSEVRGNQSSQSSGYRSEMQYNESGANPAEGIVEYYVYYENWKAVSGGGHSIQWHPNSSTGSAVLSLQNYGGKFNVVRSLSGSNFHQSGTLKTTEPNKWYKFRWELKWSTGTDGYIRLYIDDVLYYSFTGRTTTDSKPPYLKVGQNRWNMVSGQNTIVYYDNLKIYRK